MDKIVLNDVVSGANVSVINSNFQKLEDTLNNDVLFRNNPVGEPNSMNNDLDMNSHDVYNCGNISGKSLTIDGRDVELNEGLLPSITAFTIFEYTATNGQTDFDIAPLQAVPTGVLVFSDGLEVLPSLVQTSGTIVTIPARIVGAKVVIHAYQRISELNTADAINVRYIPDGPSPTQTTAAKKFYEFHTAKDRGALADGTTDDGVALRKAMLVGSYLGDRTYLSRGTYKTGASSGSSFLIDSPVSIDGAGSVYTAINPSLNGTSDDTIRIVPNPAVDMALTRLSGFALHDPTNGSRAGRHGIFINTQTTGANLAKFSMRDVQIGPSPNANSWGVYHLNNTTNNVNGGLYTALIANNQINNGIKLDGSGDSISVVHSVITGQNIGVEASLANGASLLEVQGCNITTQNGAFRLDNGHRFRFIGNNVECFAGTGAAANNNSSVVNIAGANGVIFGGVIKENLIAGFGSTDATTLIRLKNARGTLVSDNVLLSGAIGVVNGIVIENDCYDVRIGPNIFQSALGLPNKVIDNGIGTMGVVKTATLANSWVAYAVGTETLKFIKDVNGIVRLYGSIKNGTITAGTLITTLPVGFRPSGIIAAWTGSLNGATPSLTQVTIETDGSVRISFAQNTRLDINMSFPADNLANAVTTE